MKQPSYAMLLDELAREHIPAGVDLTPRIKARLAPKGTIAMKSKLALGWTTILLVVLGLGIVATAAYAVYNTFIDPGMQSVEESGLGTTLDTTAAATIQPEPVGASFALQPATPLDLSRSELGVTVRLDWIYIEESHLAFGLDVQGLTDGMRFGPPTLDFANATAEQFRGASLSLDENGVGLRGILAISQLLRPGDDSGVVSLGLTLPLFNHAGEPLADLRFDIPSIPISAGRNLDAPSIYSVYTAGQTLRLDFLSVSPLSIDADVCQPVDQAAAGYQIVKAVIMGEKPDSIDEANSVPLQGVVSYTSADGRLCQRLNFQTGEGGPGTGLRMAVTEMVAGEELVTGLWDFYVGFPSRGMIPGLLEPTLTPEPALLAQTIGDLTATVQWAYADAQRAALRIKFSRWQEEWQIWQAFTGDASGNRLDWYGSAYSPTADPSDVIVVIDSNGALGSLGERAQFGVDVPVYDRANLQTPLVSFHFDLDLPIYPATVVEPGLQVDASGLPMILTRIEMTPSYTQVVLCYDKPDASDWGISSETHIVVDGLEARMSGYRLVHDVDFQLKPSSLNEGLLPEGVTQDRCLAVEFPVGHRAATGQVSVGLSVPTLAKSLPEGFTDAMIAQANQALAGEGIRVDYTMVKGDGGGGVRLSVVEKPEGMSEEQVWQRVYAVLGCESGGPWRFAFSLEAKGD